MAFSRRGTEHDVHNKTRMSSMCCSPCLANAPLVSPPTKCGSPAQSNADPQTRGANNGIPGAPAEVAVTRGLTLHVQVGFKNCYVCMLKFALEHRCTVIHADATVQEPLYTGPFGLSGMVAPSLIYRDITETLKVYSMCTMYIYIYI